MAFFTTMVPLDRHACGWPIDVYALTARMLCKHARGLCESCKEAIAEARRAAKAAAPGAGKGGAGGGKGGVGGGGGELLLISNHVYVEGAIDDDDFPAIVRLFLF